MFTCQGNEAYRIVDNCPGNKLTKGQVIATAMGGMGRYRIGGRAKCICVPVGQVQVLKTGLSWGSAWAIPTMLQTAWSSLLMALRLQKGERLLVGGGTTSVDLAAAAIAKNHGAFEASTTRKADRSDLLKSSGAEQAFIDDRSIAKHLTDNNKLIKILELIGTATLEDSLQCAALAGVVCMRRIVGKKRSLDNFSSMDSIPGTVCLTVYDGGLREFRETPLDGLAEQVQAGTLKVQVGKVFRLDDIVEAHRTMEENRTGGKIIVLA